MKEIVGYLVFQTEILDGFTLWHCFRLVADEQPFKITAAVHTFNIFCYSSEGHIFYSLEQYVKIGRLLAAKLLLSINSHFLTAYGCSSEGYFFMALR